MAAGLLCLPLAIDGFLIGTFHVLMVWLMFAGLVHACRGRAWKGGMLLGAAVWLKLLPVIGVGYLLLKRKWRPAAVAVATVAVIDVGLCLPALGWRETCDGHLLWSLRGAASTIDDQLDGDKQVDVDRLTNQSTMVILRRSSPRAPAFPR